MSVLSLGIEVTLKPVGMAPPVVDFRAGRLEWERLLWELL